MNVSIITIISLLILSSIGTAYGYEIYVSDSIALDDKVTICHMTELDKVGSCGNINLVVGENYNFEIEIDNADADLHLHLNQDSSTEFWMIIDHSLSLDIYEAINQSENFVWHLIFLTSLSLSAFGMIILFYQKEEKF